MADNDFPKDQPEQLREATKALEEYTRALEKAQESQSKRRKALEKFQTKYEEILSKEDAARKAALEKEIADLETAAAAVEKRGTDQAKAQAEMLRAQAEFARQSKDLTKESASEMAVTLEQQESLFGDVGETIKDLTSKFEQLGFGQAGAAAAMAATTIAAKSLGMSIGFAKKEVIDQLKEFDNARRSLVPYTQGLAGANSLQAELIKKARELQMPIQDVAKFVQTASGEFRMLNLEEDATIAKLSGFAAIMEKLGVSASPKIIEEMITTGGMANIDEAIVGFESLTMKMSELGVLPKELGADYQALIPQMAMFGSAAAANIGKVSLMAKKARVDVGTLTGLADRFSGYSDAARSAQAINAVFGKPVIRDPAELVTAYYTLGEPGVLQLLQQKLMDSGIDIDPDSAGGRAKIAFLAKQFGMTRSDVMKVFDSRAVLTDEEAQKITEGATPTAGGISTELQQKASDQFRTLAGQTVTLGERFEALGEKLLVGGLEGLGIDFQSFGTNLEKGINAISEGVDGFKGSIDSLMKTFGIEIPEIVKETGKVIRDRINNPEILKQDIEDFTGSTQALNAAANTPVQTAANRQQADQRSAQMATQMAVAFVDELQNRQLNQPININATIQMDGKVVGQTAVNYMNKMFS